MKKLAIILLTAVFTGLGCSKTDQQTNIVSTADCNTSEYPFACFLDKATAAEDPNLCNESGSKRVTCLKAYEELLETVVNCDTLSDPGFQMECSNYNSKNAQIAQPKATPTEPVIDTDYINN